MFPRVVGVKLNEFQLCRCCGDTSEHDGYILQNVGIAIYGIAKFIRMYSAPEGNDSDSNSDLEERDGVHEEQNTSEEAPEAHQRPRDQTGEVKLFHMPEAGIRKTLSRIRIRVKIRSRIFRIRIRSILLKHGSRVTSRNS